MKYCLLQSRENHPLLQRGIEHYLDPIICHLLGGFDNPGETWVQNTGSRAHTCKDRTPSSGPTGWNMNWTCSSHVHRTCPAGLQDILNLWFYLTDACSNIHKDFHESFLPKRDLVIRNRAASWLCYKLHGMMYSIWDGRAIHLLNKYIYVDTQRVEKYFLFITFIIARYVLMKIVSYVQLDALFLQKCTRNLMLFHLWEFFRKSGHCRIHKLKVSAQIWFNIRPKLHANFKLCSRASGIIPTSFWKLTGSTLSTWSKLIE